VLSRLGFRILRVGNLDVYNSISTVLSAVSAALEQQVRAENPSSALRRS
jgi:very-short-patch-repair endonuclease